MFRVLDLRPDGRVVSSEGDADVRPPHEGTLRWIDLTTPDPEALALLRERFDFHPLAIEDCSAYGLQSKVDDYEKYLFIVIHDFSAVPDDPLAIQIHEVHAFVSDAYLVTVHDNPVPDHERVWQMVRSDKRQLERGPAWILYRHLDAMITAAEPLVADLRSRLDAVEDAVIEGERRVPLAEVFRIKRTTVAMRRVVRPLRDTVGILHRRSDGKISTRVALHLRDVADHVGRVADMIEEIREVAASVVASHQALEAQLANATIKRLTVFSAVFLPLSFIVGFFGQNFHDLPNHSHAWFVAMLVSLVVVPLALLEWFRRNWL